MFIECTRSRKRIDWFEGGVPVAKTTKHGQHPSHTIREKMIQIKSTQFVRYPVPTLLGVHGYISMQHFEYPPHRWQNVSLCNRSGNLFLTLGTREYAGRPSPRSVGEVICRGRSTNYEALCIMPKQCYAHTGSLQMHLPSSNAAHIYSYVFPPWLQNPTGC